MQGLVGAGKVFLGALFFQSGYFLSSLKLLFTTHTELKAFSSECVLVIMIM